MEELRGTGKAIDPALDETLMLNPAIPRRAYCAYRSALQSFLSKYGIQILTWVEFPAQIFHFFSVSRSLQFGERYRNSRSVIECYHPEKLTAFTLNPERARKISTLCHQLAMKFALLSSLALVACLVHAAPVQLPRLHCVRREVNVDVANENSPDTNWIRRNPESALVRKEAGVEIDTDLAVATGWDPALHVEHLPKLRKLFNALVRHRTHIVLEFNPEVVHEPELNDEPIVEDTSCPMSKRRAGRLFLSCVVLEHLPKLQRPRPRARVRVHLGLNARQQPYFNASRS
ncbi:hypothetical protein BYT27DRAFT_7343120 [Phlegmacium glaucopus]|nr:hypothetical protein BYT27DRAFT_7343120 [Phlegmacium glaucopus]